MFYKFKRVIFTFVAMFFMLLLTNNVIAESIKPYDKKQGYTYISLGSYPQMESGAILPIKWRVLDIDDNIAYLYSEYVLFNHRIHHDDKEWIAFNAKFNKTEIYELLNNKFYSTAFNDEEKKLITYSDELGYVFLAESKDVSNSEYGFKTDKDRKALGTEYAVKNGLFRYSLRYGGHSPYWTRTQSTTKKYGARCTKQDGNLGYIRVVVMNEGIRPAIYIDLSKLEIIKGDGTLDNPYVVQYK